MLQEIRRAETWSPWFGGWEGGEVQLSLIERVDGTSQWGRHREAGGGNRELDTGFV